MLVEHWAPILAITLAVVVCKVSACAGGTFLGGHDTRTSLRVGMSVAQIGEFSFIIASLGLTLDVTSRFLYPIAVAVSAITTLLTPYLIKSTDRVVDGLDRVAPRSLANSLRLYTRWVGQLGSQRQSSLAARLIRRWIAQMALNTTVIAAVFIATAFVGRRPPVWLQNSGLGEEWLKAGLWLAAVVLSLPMFIATSRKLQALGLLIAEIKVSPSAAGERTAAIRAVVAQVIPIAGTVILGLFVLVVGSTLLPSFKGLLVLLLLAVVISWLLRRSFIRVYSRAQAALQETLAQPPAPRPTHGTALPALLREADLASITLTADSSAAGKLIRELALRSRTGASIVAIERAGANLLNPGPDEELQPGDQVLLLGTPDQLRAARSLFNRPGGQ